MINSTSWMTEQTLEFRRHLKQQNKMNLIMLNKSQNTKINKISRAGLAQVEQIYRIDEIKKSKANAKLEMKPSHKRYSRTIEEAYEFLNPKITIKHLLR
jgi:hypothetical protein